MKLSLIIPAYNEEENIVEVLRRLETALAVPHEAVVVNDHSCDETRARVLAFAASHPGVRVVDNCLPRGFANALKTGFRAASGEVLLPIMADCCDDLSTIERMWARINDGYDVVCGSRYVTGGARLGGSRLKGFLSMWAGRSLRYLLGVPTCDIPNAFKMYRRSVIERITITSQGFEISMEMPLKAYFLGFRITEVATVWRERTKGQSSFKVVRLLPRYMKLYVWALAHTIRGR